MTKILFFGATLGLIFLGIVINPNLLSGDNSVYSNYKFKPFFMKKSIKGRYYNQEKKSPFVEKKDLFKKDFSIDLNLLLRPQPLSRPLFLSEDKGVVIASDYGEIRKYDLSGKVIWRYRLINARTGVVSNILEFRNYVIFSAMNGWMYSLNKFSGELNWSLEIGDYAGCNIVLHEGSLFTCSTYNFFSSGTRVSKINAKTGDLIWTDPIDISDSYGIVEIEKETLKVNFGSGGQFIYQNDNGELLKYSRGSFSNCFMDAVNSGHFFSVVQKKTPRDRILGFKVENGGKLYQLDFCDKSNATWKLSKRKSTFMVKGESLYLYRENIREAEEVDQKIVPYSFVMSKDFSSILYYKEKGKKVFFKTL